MSWLCVHLVMFGFLIFVKKNLKLGKNYHEQPVHMMKGKLNDFSSVLLAILWSRICSSFSEFRLSLGIFVCWLSFFG